MNHKNLEDAIKRMLRKRRWIEFLITAACFGLFLFFSDLRGQSETYTYPIIFASLASIVAAYVWISDLAICKFRTVPVLVEQVHQFTVYRGLLHTILYVDGEAKVAASRIIHTQTEEFWLPEKVRVTATFQRKMSYLVHLSFSNSTASIVVD